MTKAADAANTPAANGSRIRRGTAFAVLLAVTAALVRLVPLQWLHPLNWDEIEYYRAANWIAEGRVPFRDFWEHHTPLAWFVYAPFTLLTDSPGVEAIIAMRWVQIPVWVAVFWLANVWMRNAGLSAFGRWSAMALALSSSFLMTSAVEFRLDPLACLFYLGGLVAWQRDTARAAFVAGALFCLAGLTNMRFGPLLVLTVLLLSVIRGGRWKVNARAPWMYAGGLAALALALLYLVATGALAPLYTSIFRDNMVGDKYGPVYRFVFLHRLLATFGVRIIASDRLFEWAAVDFGGLAIVLLGAAGIVVAFRRWRTPDALFFLSVLQVANLLVIARMNFIFNYHMQIVVLMALPVIASLFERIPRRGLVLAVLVVAWCVNAFASIFRGKELDLAYQDFLMREVHARTRPGDRVWAGIPWALRREPDYRFWFMPDMTTHLVLHGYAPPYPLDRIVRNPPAAAVVDHYALVWMSRVQPELGRYFVRHYIPVWRNLWIPGMNLRLQPGARFEWIVPRDGTWKLFASPALARHRWFRQPFVVAYYEAPDSARHTLRLPLPAAHPALQWRIDGRPAVVNGAIALRKGQRLAVANGGGEVLGLILLPTDDRLLFRQPPPGATLEAASTRVTHVPRIGVRIQP